MPDHRATSRPPPVRVDGRPNVIGGLQALYSSGGGRNGYDRRRRARAWRPRPPRIIAAALAAALVLGGGAFAFSASRSSLGVEGIVEGQNLTRRDLGTLDVRVSGSGDVTVRVNGDEMPTTESNGARVIGPEALRETLVEGSNTLVVSQPGRFGLGGADIERSFTFDPGGPSIMVPAQILSPAGDQPRTLRGLVDDATTLTANGQAVALEPGGAFTVPVAAGVAEVALVATDGDGNPEAVTVGVIAEPPPAEYPMTVAVHLAARDWANPLIREQILDLARTGRINAVQLDIKDEGGEVGYASTVPMATTTGAAMGHYDARTALDELHALDVRVIGRIVCFLDPTMATWAWENSRAEMIVLQAGAGPLPTDYGTAAFTNMAHPEVRQYQIDLALEAAELGFDDILYDYVRRPEGDTESMNFPGLETAPDVAIARFVAETNVQLASADDEVLLGVSVFGIAASRPGLIAQDIGLLAPHVDYVAPMVYPSHWGPGEYGVADPLREPGPIVGASLVDFHDVVAGSGAAVVPWLQDFSAGGVTYGPVEVTAQIDATLATGSPGFILWNSGSEYTVEALSTLG